MVDHSSGGSSRANYTPIIGRLYRLGPLTILFHASLIPRRGVKSSIENGQPTLSPSPTAIFPSVLTRGSIANIGGLRAHVCLLTSETPPLSLAWLPAGRSLVSVNPKSGYWIGRTNLQVVCSTICHRDDPRFKDDLKGLDYPSRILLHTVTPCLPFEFQRHVLSRVRWFQRVESISVLNVRLY